MKGRCVSCGQSGPLPALMDVRMIRAETGLPRGVAEGMMRDLEKTRIGRRVFVQRVDVEKLLEESRITARGFPLRSVA